MVKEPKVTLQGLRVLKAFVDAVNENARSPSLAGADVMRRAKVNSGALYPLLVRFEEAGILDAAWEKQRPQNLGRPRRRLYSLTPNGVEFAKRALSEVLPASMRWQLAEG